MAPVGRRQIPHLREKLEHLTHCARMPQSLVIEEMATSARIDRRTIRAILTAGSTPRTHTLSQFINFFSEPVRKCLSELMPIKYVINL